MESGNDTETSQSDYLQKCLKNDSDSRLNGVPRQVGNLKTRSKKTMEIVAPDWETGYGPVAVPTKRFPQRQRGQAFPGRNPVREPVPGIKLPSKRPWRNRPQPPNDPYLLIVSLTTWLRAVTNYGSSILQFLGPKQVEVLQEINSLINHLLKKMNGCSLRFFCLSSIRDFTSRSKDATWPSAQMGTYAHLMSSSMCSVKMSSLQYWKLYWG